MDTSCGMFQTLAKVIYEAKLGVLKLQTFLNLCSMRFFLKIKGGGDEEFLEAMRVLFLRRKASLFET